ncbi:MAG: prohibitin family protein [Candidatus Bathyarchaeota archaeon]
MSDNIAFHHGIKLAMFLVIGFFVLIFLLIFFPIRVINAGEVGVLLEFGRVKEIWQPGVHLLIPFMNDVVTMSTQIQKFEADATAASADLQIVQTTIAVNYRIPSSDAGVQTLYENFRGDQEMRIIQPIVQEVVKSNTAKRTAAELITKRETVKQTITADLRERLAEYDIDLIAVSITNFDFSPEFNKAIESKVVVEQELQQAQLELQKKQVQVQQLIAEKNASAISMVIEATAQAESQVLRANAEAEAINTITQSLNDPYVRYLYVQRWNGQVPKVTGSGQNIIDVSSLVE